MTGSGLLERERVQRRILTVLILGQLLAGAGLAAVGALLAEDLLGGPGLSGLPSALFTGGSALAAVFVGRLSQARGRRPGLAAGFAFGALGAVGIVVATSLESLPLLFAAFVVYGSGTATNLQARYAGADLATPASRARSLSYVLLGTTAGAVAGPSSSPSSCGPIRCSRRDGGGPRTPTPRRPRRRRPHPTPGTTPAPPPRPACGTPTSSPAWW